MLHFSFTMIHNKLFAEEIVQDVFSLIWKNKKQLKGVSNIDAYLYKSTRNKTIDHIRSHKNDITNIAQDNLDLFQSYVFTNTNPENELVTKELAQKLNDEILNLPEKAQLVFRMIKEDGLSYQQVAELLNISTKTVDNHLSKSIKRIREVIKAYMDEETSAGSRLRVVK